MERPDSSKYPTKEAYDKAHDRWAENQQYTTTTTTPPSINLITAAAPDMLDALRSAIRMLTRDPIDDAKLAVIKKCSDAVEKATGEEPQW